MNIRAGYCNNKWVIQLLRRLHVHFLHFVSLAAVLLVLRTLLVIVRFCQVTVTKTSRAVCFCEVPFAVPPTKAEGSAVGGSIFGTVFAIQAVCALVNLTNPSDCEVLTESVSLVQTFLIFFFGAFTNAPPGQQKRSNHRRKNERRTNITGTVSTFSFVEHSLGNDTNASACFYLSVKIQTSQ